jgi:O-methyltransferase
VANSSRLISRLRSLVPAKLRPVARAIAQPILRMTTEGRKQKNHARWVAESYSAFGQAERERILLSICRFCHINRPIDGYYMEFGCHEANTMRMAWRHSQYLFKWTYVAFDSFEGLPEIEAIDRQEIWEKGKLKTSEEDFVRRVTGAGMPRDRLITVSGFYDRVLTHELADKLLPRKAAVIYIDCDLYHSAVPVLRFIPPFLQPGTTIVFDDWNCFLANPAKGERLAWREFLETHPDLAFEPFISTAEAQAFLFVGRKT